VTFSLLKCQKPLIYKGFWTKCGGEAGIRTRARVAPTNGLANLGQQLLKSTAISKLAGLLKNHLTTVLTTIFKPWQAVNYHCTVKHCL
jgi:hypothetical protein